MSGDAAHALVHHRGDTPGGESQLCCTDAARLLDVPPAALQTWSERLAFPCDVGGATGPRFRRAEIEALRDALPQAHSINGAIQVARRRVLA
ncbi:hypothetical protein [Conexibacter sp. CPCC 206217]|uniref:hypothetical protein n=1 Tax=Conexibacter sp. CPCC 206217 TaxID=3064574 RepID=UPI002728CA2A|nr:hypothetical protein [Conexibacter sp. CPCC 206217]MDO8210470.1 hypothetical protein [Conexibacter sp. CPCC 206217]